MKKLVTTLIALGALGSTQAMAQELTIKVTNLTSAMYFTPLLSATHDNNSYLFKEGAPASANLQAMAEGGDISNLSADIQAAGGNVNENPVAGMLAPGANVGFDLTADAANMYFSLTAMLLPTNDAFVGIDSLNIPSKAGTYTYYLNAYDAGTEANNEIINGAGASGALGIPADPGGNSGSDGTGITSTTENGMIHIHRGNIGDTDLSGGASDLSSTVHRWLNPVAKLVITVN